MFFNNYSDFYVNSNIILKYYCIIIVSLPLKLCIIAKIFFLQSGLTERYIFFPQLMFIS